MKLVLDPSKSAQENAAAYYAKAQKLRSKAEGAKKALQDTLREVAREERREHYAPAVAPVAQKRAVRIKRDAQWYERFHWFFTSGGLLVIGGRDASQNETVFSKYALPGDLFFHADVHGAPVTILKEGAAKATAQDRKETAQFAVSYSSAWKNGLGSADAYCLPAEQVSKQAKAGEYVGKGSFVMSGKREWFRNTELALRIGIDGERRIAAIPASSPRTLEKEVLIVPGTKEKGDAAKDAHKRLGAGLVDDMLLVLPAGTTQIISKD